MSERLHSLLFQLIRRKDIIPVAKTAGIIVRFLFHLITSIVFIFRKIEAVSIRIETASLSTRNLRVICTICLHVAL